MDISRSSFKLAARKLRVDGYVIDSEPSVKHFNSRTYVMKSSLDYEQ